MIPTPRLSRVDTAVLVALVLFMIGLFVWLTFASPRPYTIVEGDIENDYFYNTLTESEGFAELGSAHPGRPARWAYLVLFRLFGTDTGPSLQIALNWGYFFTFVATAGAAVWFYRLVRHHVPSAIALLAVLTSLVTPPALAYYNHFGSESFIVPSGLILVGITWHLLRAKCPPSLMMMVVVGVVAGMCLSTKHSFIPMVIAVFAALGLSTLVHHTLRDNGTLNFWATLTVFSVRFGAMCAATALVHGLTCLPLGLQFIRLWRNTLTRPDAFPGDAPFVAAFAQSVWRLTEVNPVLVICWLVSLGIVVLWGIRNAPGTREAIPLGLFVFIANAALVYTLASSAHALHTFYDVGFELRNAGPSFLAIPATILTAWSLRRAPASPDHRFEVAGFATCLALVVSATTIHMDRRERFLQDYARYSTAAMQRFAELREPGTRIAFWERNSGQSLGDAAFRFWGNYKWYKQRAYDEETLKRFPGYTFFPLRDMHRMHRDQSAEDRARRDDSPPEGWWHRLKRTAARKTLASWFPDRDTADYGWINGLRRLYVGEEAGVEVSAFVFTVAQERQELKIPRADLIDQIEDRVGPVQSWEEDLGGQRWVVIKVLGDQASWH